jgi:hypothetical protein
VTDEISSLLSSPHRNETPLTQPRTVAQRSSRRFHSPSLGARQPHPAASQTQRQTFNSLNQPIDSQYPPVHNALTDSYDPSQTCYDTADLAYISGQTASASRATRAAQVNAEAGPSGTSSSTSTSANITKRKPLKAVLEEVGAASGVPKRQRMSTVSGVDLGNY